MAALFSRQSSARHPRRVTSWVYFAAGAWLRLICPQLGPLGRLLFDRCPVIHRVSLSGQCQDKPQRRRGKGGRVARYRAGVVPCRIGAEHGLAMLKNGARAKPKPAGAGPGAGRAVCLTDGHILGGALEQVNKKARQIEQKTEEKTEAPWPMFFTKSRHPCPPRSAPKNLPIS